MSKPTPLRADEVLLALSRRHAQDLWLTEVKTGPTWTAAVGQLHRIDGIAIKRSWTAPCITGYEVKISRQDWVRDEKWHAALPDCHAFYCACPPDLIQPEELPAEVGLIWVLAGGRVSVRRKAVRRDVDLSPLLLYHIVISRTEPDRHPFFSGTREALEAWVADKKARQGLGIRVRGHISDVVAKAEDRAEAAEREASRLREDAQKWRRTSEILAAAGHDMRWGGWRWEETVQRLATGGAPAHIERRLRDAAREITAVADALGPAERETAEVSRP